MNSISIAAVATMAFALDRITKALALRWLAQGTAWWPFIELELVINRGASWGIFHDAGSVMHIILAVVVAVLLCAVGYLLINAHKDTMRLGYALVLAGGVSNLIDRILYKGVVDFISFGDLPVFQFSFNLADIAVLIGLGLLVIEGERL